MARKINPWVCRDVEGSRALWSAAASDTICAACSTVHEKLCAAAVRYLRPRCAGQLRVARTVTTPINPPRNKFASRRVDMLQLELSSTARAAPERAAPATLAVKGAISRCVLVSTCGMKQVVKHSAVQPKRRTEWSSFGRTAASHIHVTTRHPGGSFGDGLGLPLLPTFGTCRCRGAIANPVSRHSAPDPHRCQTVILR